MKVRRIARLMAIVLTLVTMVSCMAVVLTVDTSAVSTNATSNCLIISGTDLANANERNQVTTISTTDGVWKFKTTGNDPYVNTAAISGVGDTVLRTYPYVVVRYKCSTFTSMEIFCGHPNTAARRVSMPAPETNGQWGCLFYDFSPFPNEYKSWFRLEMATASGIEMEIAEVVLFKNTADVTAYHSVYAKAGGGGCEVLTFNDMGYHGNGVTGRTGNSGDVSGVTEVRPDSNTAMFNEGGYFTRLSSGGNDGYLEFRQNNGAATNGVKNFGKVAVRYRTTSSYNGRTMQLFFAVNGAYSEGNSSKATIVGDGHWQWAFFTNPLKGSANSLRFDYMTGTGHVDVAEIYFYNNTADVYSSSVGAASRRNVANSTWFHSGMYFLHKNSTTYFTSVGTISGGTLNGQQRSATGSNFYYGTAKTIAAGRTFYAAAGTHSAHQDNGGTVTANATCTAAGSKRYNCTLCNDQTRTEAIAALGHANGPAATCTTAQVCTRCSVQLAAALGHASVTDAAVAPDCTHTGLTEGAHCSRCSTVLTQQNVVDALGHDEKIDAAVDPYCTTTGLTEGKHCDRCSVVLIAQEIIDALGHAEVVDAAVAPDCTNTGLTEGCHCSRCSTVLTAQETVAALGHNEVIDAAVAATCTETGLTEGCHCSRCEEVLTKQNVVDALGHDEKIDAAVEPYCTTTGLTEGKHCDRCSVILIAQEIIDALGHAEVVDAAVAPYCTTTGLTEGKHCNRCEVVLIAQNVVDALGHEEVADAAVAADCTNAGKTAGKHCNRCSEILLAQEIIEALGHNIIVNPGTPATYTTTGLTEGTKCSRCEDATSEQTVIPTKNPLLTYNVALNERFAVNMKYVAFDGATVKVVDETGVEYAFTVSDTGTVHDDGLPIYAVRIADISARNIGHVFAVCVYPEGNEEYGHSTGVSVKGYCDKVDALYGNKTEAEIAAGFEAAGYAPEQAAAMAAKQVLANAVTQKMDIYGQAAENYFAPNGADHNGLATRIGDAYGATDSSRTVKNTGEVIFKGATVVFGDVVELVFKMENYNHEKIYVDDVEVPADEIMDRLSTDGTYVYFSIFVKADELSHAFTVRAGSVEEDYIDYFAGSSTVTYSVDTYITSMQKKYAEDASDKGKATVNLVNALGHYGASATAYKKG